MIFNGNKISWTPSMKEFAEETLTKKLDRLVDDFTNTEVRVSKLPEWKFVKVDVSIGSYRAQATGKNFYPTLEDVAAKLKNIITRSIKDKGKKKKFVTLDYLFENKDDTDYLITKEKEFVLDPISMDEAIECFEETDYPFYVYKDIDYGNVVSILYRRRDDTFGVIRCK